MTINNTTGIDKTDIFLLEYRTNMSKSRYNTTHECEIVATTQLFYLYPMCMPILCYNLYGIGAIDAQNIHWIQTNSKVSLWKNLTLRENLTANGIKAIYKTPIKCCSRLTQSCCFKLILHRIVYDNK